MKTHFYKIRNGPLDQIQMEVDIPDRLLFPMTLLKAKTTNTPVDKVMLTRDDVLHFLALCIKMFGEQHFKDDVPQKSPDTIVMDKSNEDDKKVDV